MSLSSEERRKIYEEEKDRIEAERKQRQNERTLAGLRPGVAGLLCYLGGWVTGVIFLVLEQKDRFIRFHAAQSIVVFGFLNIVFLILRPMPFAGWFLGVILGVFAFVLWIVLMVRAGQEELLRLPVAGDLAEKILGSPPTPSSSPGPSQSTETQEITATGSAAAPLTAAPKSETRRSTSAGRAGRIAGSAFIIAWSIALLVFLNFFHDYIAYYHLETTNAASYWVREPIFNSDFRFWLPVVNTVLAFTIAGHIMLLAIDKYIVREPTLLILDVFGIVSVGALLSIFPLDFRPFGEWSGPIDLSVRITLALVIFGISIGILVRFIKIVVNVIRGTATY